MRRARQGGLGVRRCPTLIKGWFVPTPSWCGACVGGADVGGGGVAFDEGVVVRA